MENTKRAGIFTVQNWKGRSVGAPQTAAAWFQMPFPKVSMGSGIWFSTDQTGPLRQSSLGLNYSYRFRLAGHDALSIGLSAMGSERVFSTDWNVVEPADARLPLDDGRRKTTANAEAGLVYRSRLERDENYWFAGLSARQLLARQTGFDASAAGFDQTLHGRLQAGRRWVGEGFDWQLRADLDWAATSRWRGAAAVRMEIPSRFWAEIALISDFSVAANAGFAFHSTDDRSMRLGLEVTTRSKQSAWFFGPTVGAMAVFEFL